MSATNLHPRNDTTGHDVVRSQRKKQQIDRFLATPDTTLIDHLMDAHALGMPEAVEAELSNRRRLARQFGRSAPRE